MSSTTTQNQNMNVIVSFEGKPTEYLSAKLAWELNSVSMAKETIKVVDRHISQTKKALKEEKDDMTKDYYSLLLTLCKTEKLIFSSLCDFDSRKFLHKKLCDKYDSTLYELLEISEEMVKKGQTEQTQFNALKLMLCKKREQLRYIVS